MVVVVAEAAEEPVVEFLEAAVEALVADAEPDAEVRTVAAAEVADWAMP